MSIRIRPVTAIALAAAPVLAATGCATSSTPASSSSSSSAAPSVTTSDKTITWGYDQEFYAYNGNTGDGNASSNTVVLNGVLAGFWQFKPDGSLLANTDFGTYEKTADSPLTVKYTISPKAVWSDGKPIDCDDIALTWISRNGKTGDKGFSAASTAGYEQMNAPTCKAGEKAFTITYTKPFADWAAMFGPGEILPAHIVEAQSGMTKTFVDYLATPTSPDLAKAIEFYNKSWQFNPGELKKDLIPSSGPYVIDSWSAGQSLTLKANTKYYGTPPATGTIVLRYLAGTAQAQALQNGEIQVMDPQPQTDVVKQLQALGDKITYSSQDLYTFEHLDFNFKGVFADKTVREAFAKCVPRQQIVDNLIKPLNPNAKIFQSRFIFPFQPEYSGFATGVGGEKYDTVDIAGAKTLLAGKTPTVRIGWKKDPKSLNKRRVDTVALLQASCGQAGFKVEDAGTATFFAKELPAGNFDVALYAWQGSPLISGNTGIYNTGGGQNHQAYSNPQLDKLWDQVNQETDKAKQTELLKQVDTILWDDLATIPLFTHPQAFASSKDVSNITPNATQADITWNVASWARA